MTATQQVDSLRQQLTRVAAELLDSGIMQHSRHGNMSARVPGTNLILLTTPTFANLTPDSLPLLDLSGRLVDGHIDPAAHEIVHMHTDLYNKRPDLGGIIHTHSPHATAYAVASRSIECVYEGLARLGVVEPVPVAQYGPRGSDQAVENILAAVGEDTKALLLENHGTLTFDRSLEQARQLAVALEEAAEVSLRATILGGAKPIPPEMAAYAIQRAAEFAAVGTVHAQGGAA